MLQLAIVSSSGFIIIFVLASLTLHILSSVPNITTIGYWVLVSKTQPTHQKPIHHPQKHLCSQKDVQNLIKRPTNNKRIKN